MVNPQPSFKFSIKSLLYNVTVEELPHERLHSATQIMRMRSCGFRTEGSRTLTSPRRDEAISEK